MSANNRRNAAANVETGDLSPGEYLRAEIERLALDQVGVSKATGVSRQSINNIINGRQPISRAMAGKLGRLTGHGSDYWLRQSFPIDAASRNDKRSTADDAPHAFSGGILVNHQILRDVKDGLIDIEPFAARNVQAAAIYLTLGNIIITAGGGKIDIGHGKGYLLKAGHMVTVTTKERIGLPRDYVGRIGVVNRLGTAGILVSHTFQIEPGFEGRLSFSLFNAGPAFRMRAGDPVVGLEIVRLAVPPAA